VTSQDDELCDPGVVDEHVGRPLVADIELDPHAGVARAQPGDRIREDGLLVAPLSGDPGRDDVVVDRVQAPGMDDAQGCVDRLGPREGLVQSLRRSSVLVDADDHLPDQLLRRPVLVDGHDRAEGVRGGAGDGVARDEPLEAVRAPVLNDEQACPAPEVAEHPPWSSGDSHVCEGDRAPGQLAELLADLLDHPVADLGGIGIAEKDAGRRGPVRGVEGVNEHDIAALTSGAVGGELQGCPLPAGAGDSDHDGAGPGVGGRVLFGVHGRLLVVT
jgi:hypothetical protein